jgi:two-component system LytT family response regulator
MIRTILIDDEQSALDVLQLHLKHRCPQVEIVAVCGDSDEGIQAINSYKPDLVFLDIEMPGKNGFDVIQQFPKPEFSVIFVTAYNQYAIKAIKFAAIDYLLKPIDPEELGDAISRFEKQDKNTIQDQMKKLLDTLKPAPSSHAGRIALHTTEGLNMVQPNEIVHCLAVSNYTKIFLNKSDKPVMVSKTLKEVEDILGDQLFFRVHNSHLVNISHVSKYVKADGGYIVMSNGENITIARNRKEGFMERFAKL